MAETMTRAALAAMLVGAVATAQDPTGAVRSPEPGTVRGLQSPWEQAMLGDKPVPPVTGDPDLDGVTSNWVSNVRTAPFQGFPTFPARLGGYGGLPTTLGQLFGRIPIGGERSMLPVVPAELEAGWPTWLRFEDREALPYQPDLALLVQNSERVWWKDAGEDAAVPLHPWDKLRPAAVGVEVAVRQTGQFELHFHGGGRLEAQGLTRLVVDQLDEEVVALTIYELTFVELQAAGREHRVTLPDGSTVVIAATPAPSAPPPAAGFPGLAPVAPVDPSAPAAEPILPPSPSLIVIERQDEPGWRSARATLWNGGGGDVSWRHAYGDQPLEQGRRVTFLLTPVRDPIGAALRAGGVVREGQVVLCGPADDGAVAWCGARFLVPAGAHVRLDPGQGDPFDPAPSALK